MRFTWSSLRPPSPPSRRSPRVREVRSRRRTTTRAPAESSSGSGSGGGSGSTSSSSGASSGASSGTASSSTSSSGTGSGSGAGSTSSSGSGGFPTEAGPGTCADTPPPPTALRSVALVLTGVDLGDASASDWATIGFDLDGKCSTKVSTDVCTLAPGASKATQIDGNGGIDNSWGENICPILETVSGIGACSTKLGQVYVQTDANGTGTLSLAFGGQPLEFPIRDAHVAMNGSGGVLAAVAQTTGVINGLQAVAGAISTSLCSGAAFQSIAQQIEQASDIMTDGTNPIATPCNAISIGLEFTGSSPFNGVFPVVGNPCGDGGP